MDIPQNIEAEKAVLGSMLLDPGVIGEVLEVIPLDQAGCFMGAGHSKCYRAFVALYRSGKPPDLLAYMDAGAGADEQIDSDYLRHLMDVAVSAANARYYAALVADKAKIAEIVVAGMDIQRIATNNGQPVSDIIAQVQKRLIDATQDGASSGPKVMADGVPGRIDEILHSSAAAGLTTGFAWLDSKLGGMRGGEMIVLAARPGVGKTSFGLAVLNHVATHLSRHAGFFSLEMNTAAIIDRLISMTTGVDGRLMRTPRYLSTWQRKRIEESVNGVAWGRIHIDQTSGLDSGEMIVRAMSLKRRYDIGFILVDYLQLLRNSDGRRENRQAEITRVSGAVKEMAKSLDVPVLALAQLNRQVEQRSGKPQLSDLRESGAIEQDADCVMFLYRKGTIKEGEAPPDDEEIYLSISKQRNGPLGRKLLVFTRATTVFTEPEVRAAVDAYVPPQSEEIHEPEPPEQANEQEEVPF